MRSYSTDHRTPMAWRHRDANGHHHPRNDHSSVTTTSDDERDEVPMVRGHRRPPSRPGSRYHREFSSNEPYPAPGPPFRTGGTLRSTRSVPALALATWDGEPCPVHGHGLPHYPPPFPPPSAGGTMRRHGSLFDVRMPPYYPGHAPLHFAPPTKAYHPALMHNPYLMPPMMRPRPFVIPAGAEPLPVRDPYKSARTPPASGYAGSKAEDAYSVNQVCCKGHLIVLWIILAVVTIGVILGIVLGVTIA